MKKLIATVIVTFFLLATLPSIVISEDSGGDEFVLDDYMQEALEEEALDENSSILPYQEYVPGAGRAPNMTDYMAGEVIVGFKEDYINVSEIETFEGHDIINKIEELNIALIRVEPNNETEFISEVEQRDDVYYAELNTVYYASWEPNDPHWDKQWGPKKIGCPSAWNTQRGDYSVWIAIVDTGVDYFHEDKPLSIHQGWDFVNNDNEGLDDNGHGTHCAGIAAARLDNAIGVAGVVRAGIIPVKVLDQDGGGSAFNVAQGILFAASEGAWIISLSLGMPGSRVTVRLACNIAYHVKRVLLIAAAGNHPPPPRWVHTPARYNSVIAVGAVDQNKDWCTFSNYGVQLELAAPGDDIYSMLPNDDYGYGDGTSMAAPHVAGVAALYYSKTHSKTPVICRTKLANTAEDLWIPLRDRLTGWGLVRADRMVASNSNVIAVTTPIGGSVTMYPDQPWYDFDTVVQLTANADSGWTFAGWDGDLSGSNYQETIIMDSDKTVTATFIEKGT